MDGVVNLYKPPGITSTKALYTVRQIVKQRKSGHAGTLDLAAEGVLLLCMGRGTKLVESIMGLPKVYRTVARLDKTSLSFDAEHGMQDADVTRVATPDEVRAALAAFEGDILQVPPAVSALKVGGQPAYKLSRAGKPHKFEPRPVRIYWTNLLRCDWPEVEFDVACGRGTYIRALIRDVGERLGTGGCVTKLTRLSVGPFHVERSWHLHRLHEIREPSNCLVELERAKSLIAEGTAPPPRP